MTSVGLAFLPFEYHKTDSSVNICMSHQITLSLITSANDYVHESPLGRAINRINRNFFTDARREGASPQTLRPQENLPRAVIIVCESRSILVKRRTGPANVCTSFALPSRRDIFSRHVPRKNNHDVHAFTVRPVAPGALFWASD